MEFQLTPIVRILISIIGYWAATRSSFPYGITKGKVLYGVFFIGHFPLEKPTYEEVSDIAYDRIVCVITALDEYPDFSQRIKN